MLCPRVISRMCEGDVRKGDIWDVNTCAEDGGDLCVCVFVCVCVIPESVVRCGVVFPIVIGYQIQSSHW